MSGLPLPIDGLETRLRLAVGSLAGPDLAAARQCIDDATAMALDEVPSALATQWELDLPRTVEVVVYTVARRIWENPSGLSQEISGEHTITTSATSGVFLTPRERQTVRKAAGMQAGFASVPLTATQSPLRPNWWRSNW